MTGDTRVWMHRKGESRLFGHPDDIPEGEDWQRFPLPQDHGEELEAELSKDGTLNSLSRNRLMQLAAERGIAFDIAWTKSQLKQAIFEVGRDDNA